MSRHTPLMPALALSLLAATACSGGQSGSPIAGATPGGPTPAPASVPTTPLPEAAGSHALGGFAADGDLLAGALALYTVDVDPDTLSAAARLKETRQGAANDDLYLLSISNFLRPTSFEVTAVSGNPGSLTLDYQFTHPFPAPADLDATPNAFSNRADLGITGMLLFLSDVADAAGNTYFDEGGAGKVVANTELVLDPDAYYRPAGLIDATGTANTFPYKAIVDERLDPRTSTATGTPISNGGDPTGNFGADGWTRDDMGATHDGWTGYGYLHGGQTARNSLRLGRNALENTGPFSLDVAVIAKYQDPRGGANSREKRANRLPPPAPDHTRFAYRGNHSALDVERIAFAGESGGFISNQVSASTLSFKLTDWDARATETTAADLSEEADVTLVAPGESGLPGFAVSIPGVLGDATAISTWDPATDVVDDDSGFGGDAGSDSGRPNDELFYQKAVTKLPGSGQTDGTYTGMARATDPEQANPLALPLDGDTLLPLTTNLPEPVTYQAFEVDLITPNFPPSLTLQNPASTVASGNGVLTFTVTAYNDPDGDPVQLQFDWNNDGDYSDTGEGLQTVSGATPIPFNSPIFYNNPSTTPDNRSVPYRYTDGVVAPISGTGSFTLGGNQAPVVAGTVGLQTASMVQPATFTLTTSGFSATDPEGDAVTFTVTADANNNGTVEQTASGIATLAGYNATPVMGPYTTANSPVRFRIYANDPLHAGVLGTQATTSPATLLGTVTLPNNPPTLTLQNPAGPVASGNGVLTFDVTAYNDPDGNTVQIQFDWNNDADYADTGEALQNVTGPTPVPFNSPIFYNNPTLTPGIRNVPYRYTDGIVAPITGTGQFTLGPNQAPTFAGTVGLQNSTLAEPATFQLTTSGFSVSDPEGDALSFTVTADANNNGSVEQTASNVLSLSGYNAAPVMGPWGSGSSDVRFRAYVNDALHAGTSGTALTTSPSPLLGTISSTPCGLSMAAVNTTLASLTTGNVVRADTAPDQVITGIRVGWTDIAGELEYVVQRATWADGATIGSLAFSNLATVAANTTSYDDTTVNTQGTRYLYRVAPRCVVGSTTVGTPSQLAMVALQDFEGLAAGTNLITSPNLGNGWTVNYTHSANQTATISSGANALNGARSAEVTEANQGATNAALTLSPPHINDRAALGTITVSRFEMEHALANSAQQNVGYSILTNTGRFTNGTTTAPLAPNNWRWIPTSGASSAGLGYNDNTNTAMTTLFSNISGQIGASNFNWGVGPLGESYTALDATVGTITNAHDYLFIAAASATSNPDENMRFDDVAWIVY